MKRVMHVPALVALAGGLGVAATPAAAQLDDGDVGLTIVDGRIVTFLIPEDEDEGLLSSAGGEIPEDIVETRIFIGEIGKVEFEPFDPSDPFGGGPDVFQGETPLVTDFSTNTPGFDSGPGVFEPGAFVGFTINNGLQVYAPETDSLISATVAEGLLGAGGTRGGFEQETLAVEFDGVAFQTNVAPEVSLPISFATPIDSALGLPVFSDGRFHRHWNFSVLPVDDPTSPTSATPLADPAVYVAELTMITSQSGVAPSERFFFVFPIGLSESDPELAAAVAHLETLIDEGATGCNPADIALTDGEFGTLDGNDIAAFVQNFLSGCP